MLSNFKSLTNMHLKTILYSKTNRFYNPYWWESKLVIFVIFKWLFFTCAFFLSPFLYLLSPISTSIRKYQIRFLSFHRHICNGIAILVSWEQTMWAHRMNSNTILVIQSRFHKHQLSNTRKYLSYLVSTVLNLSFPKCSFIKSPA